MKNSRSTDAVRFPLSYDQLPDQISVPEYSAYVGCSRATGYAHVAEGVVPSVRYGRFVRIPKTVLKTGFVFPDKSA